MCIRDRVGVGLGVASSANRSDATAAGVGKTCVDPNAPGCADVRSATNASNGTGTGAIVAYVVGGALLGGALVSMLILKPWKEKSRSVSVMPSLGGVVAIGTF